MAAILRILRVKPLKGRGITDLVANWLTMTKLTLIQKRITDAARHRLGRVT